MKLTTEQQVERLQEYVSSVKENMAVQLFLVRRAENAERQLEQERRDRTAEILRAVESAQKYVARITQLEMDKEYLTKRLAGSEPEFRAKADGSDARWSSNLKHVIEDSDRLERRGKTVQVQRRYATEPESMDPPTMVDANQEAPK